METKFLIISILCFIIALILLLIQGISNYKFFLFNDKKIIAEKTLYEQFSYEVYSSINTPLPVSFKINQICDDSYEPFKISLNLDTFFDLRDIYNSDLNSECKDNIIPNYTSCTSSEIDYNNYEKDKDIRLNFGPNYFSKFTQKVSKLNNFYICKSKESYSYDKLLNNIDYDGKCKNDFHSCGILDTKNNYLCLPYDVPCPLNKITFDYYHISDDYIGINDKYITFYNQESTDNKVIVSIILSENYPLNHEWEKMVKDTYEDIEDIEIQKRKRVSLNDFSLFNNEKDDSYDLIDNSGIKVRDIQNYNLIKKFDSEKYNLEQELNMYVRNYIGFKNIEELNKFRKIFNNKDDRDNPLYKLSSSGYNPLVTIIISSIFLFLSIIYLIILLKKLLPENISFIFPFIFIILIILFLICILIIISSFYRKYHIIDIDMDSKMKIVLDLYNKRIINNQIFRLISFFFHIISAIFMILYFYKKQNKISLLNN